jgi:hypothetical protein
MIVAFCITIQRNQLVLSKRHYSFIKLQKARGEKYLILTFTTEEVSNILLHIHFLPLKIFFKQSPLKLLQDSTPG